VALLAKNTNSHEDSLYRLLRALTNWGVFRELDGRRFELTNLGRCLQTDVKGSMKDMILLQGEYQQDHWRHLFDCVRTGKNAAEQVRSASLFGFFEKDKKAGEIFDRAMTNISDLATDPIVAAYDFSQVDTIADIGGGAGRLVSSILQSNPHMKGIVFDLPNVAPKARENFDRFEIAGRAEAVTGSFFDEIKIDADVFILKHIIHDWSDEESLMILKNLKDTMNDDSKLLIVECVVPQRNVRHLAKILDLEMLVNVTGRERTEQEYSDLLTRAGLKLARVIPTASPGSILEIVKA
jgi:hypothetical protein